MSGPYEIWALPGVKLLNYERHPETLASGEPAPRGGSGWGSNPLLKIHGVILNYFLRPDIVGGNIMLSALIYRFPDSGNFLTLLNRRISSEVIGSL
jgi:hypothetical protein